MRTGTAAVAVRDVLSDDTATTDRVDKPIDGTTVSSLRCYVLLEKIAPPATLLRRELGGAWAASAHPAGTLALPGLDIALPLPDHQELRFPTSIRN